MLFCKKKVLQINDVSLLSKIYKTKDLKYILQNNADNNHLWFVHNFITRDVSSNTIALGLYTDKINCSKKLPTKNKEEKTTVLLNYIRKLD